MKIKCSYCGNNKEFITQPNKYDIYEIIDNQLQYQNSENTNEEFKLYCRECSKELKQE